MDLLLDALDVRLASFQSEQAVMVGRPGGVRDAKPSADLLVVHCVSHAAGERPIHPTKSECQNRWENAKDVSAAQTGAPRKEPNAQPRARACSRSRSRSRSPARARC